jgi:CHAD domain-containing protein
VADTNLEQEVKLEVASGFVLPPLGEVDDDAEVRSRPVARLRAVYVDTQDLRLLRHGVTLRHRRDLAGQGREHPEGRGVWTLKLPSPADGKGLVRLERNWPGGAGTPPSQAAALVKAYTRGAPLAPIARLVTERRRTVVSHRGEHPLVEVDDDTVSVLDGRRIAARFREIEVELVDADAGDTLDKVVERLRTAGAFPSDGRPKVARAVGAVTVLSRDEVDGQATVRQVVAAAIGAGYRRLVDHDAGVRLDEDPEDVHQARVGTRRLRSDLRTFRPFLDAEWTAETREELGWLAASLGAVRDADVLGARLAGRRQELAEEDRDALEPIQRRLERQRRDARRALLEVMETPRYLRLLERLLDASQHPPLAEPTAEQDGASENGWVPAIVPPGAAPNGLADAGEAPAAGGLAPGGDRAAGEGPAAAEGPAPVGASAVGGDPSGGARAPVAVAAHVPPSPLGVPAPLTPVGDLPAADALIPLVRKPYRRLRRTVRDAGDEPTDVALHQVRIRAKRLRYACEAVAGVAGADAQRTAKNAADLQGVLGDHHDAVVAESWLRDAARAARGREEALVVGELIGFERRDQKALAAQWPGAWRKLKKRSRRRWMAGEHHR